MQGIYNLVWTVVFVLMVGAAIIAVATLELTDKTPRMIMEEARTGQPAAPPPSLGEIFGMVEDDEGHWSRAR